MTESIPIWMWVVGLLAILGPLVTLHELGHYLVGRWFGVGAQAFSVGFGKELVGFNDKRGTRWKLSALPLGGYVQFKGDMNAASMPEGEESDATFGMATDDALDEDAGNTVVGASFHEAALWKRALIVFAGPAMNLIIAIAIFAAFFAVWGKPVPVDPADSNVIQSFAENSVARDAGIEVGDRIVAIDGDKTVLFKEIADRVIMFPDREIVITVERDGARFDRKVQIASSIETDKFGNESRLGRLGVMSTPLRFEPVGLGTAIALAGDHTVWTLDMMVTGIGQIFTGERSIRELGGPVKIAKYSGEQLSLGPLAYFQFAALISINLAFINLLPIPTLDGGHLAFYAAEAVRRKPVGLRGQEWAFRTGFALVLMLMLFVTINDIVSLPIFSS